MGIKKIAIDWKKVDEMLSNFCEGTEVAAVLGISYATLERRVKEKFSVDFVEFKRQKRAKGEEMLRELQVKSAKKGNVIMQIWLGKQYLKQSDKQDHTTGGEKIQPLNITVVEKSTTEKLQKLINEPMPN